MGRVLTGLVGHDNVAYPTLSGLTTNFGLQCLLNKPVAVISDARISSRPDTAVVVERILSITGEDALTVDRKYKTPLTVALPTRFVILTNELPRLPDSSGAFASRFLVLRLTKSFYGKEDPNLTKKLLTELPGILLWALRGLQDLRANGRFVQPMSGAQMVRELEDLSSPIGAFVRDRCNQGPNKTVTCKELFRNWIKWCDENGHSPIGTVQTFGRDLRAAFPQIGTKQTAKGSRERKFVGIGLKK